MEHISDKVILGIDPGTTIMGYGAIHAQGKNPVLVDMGIVDLRKCKDHYLKLQIIYEKTVGLVDRFKPDEVAIEAPFYGKNVQSMLKLGRAQGVAIAAAISRDVPVFEYAPRKIKMAITSVGTASKEQVAAMLARMFNIDVLPKNLDATDGLAAAVCHFYQKGPHTKNSSTKSWEDYIRKNPGRVK